MPSFIYEKLVLRVGIIGTFCAVIFLFIFAFFTDEGIWGPRYKHAPFVERDENGEIVAAKFIDYSVDKPHRTEHELGSWTSVIVSEALTFELSEFKELLERLEVKFTEDGFNQYRRYLQSSGTLDNLKDGYRVSAIVDQKPILLNNKEIDKVYRWLYQIPVKVTFMPAGSRGYSSSTRAVTRELMLLVQIKRVRLEEDPNAIQIESWKVTRRR